MRKQVLAASPAAAAVTAERIDGAFATVLHSDDVFWRGDSDRVGTVAALIAAGCGYFIVAGDDAEALHDQIDEVIERLGALSVVTTFHAGEAPEDVAAFAVDCTGEEMGTILVLTERANLAQAIERYANPP
jgi:hypothetical protein